MSIEVISRSGFDQYGDLVGFLTAERLSSYFRACSQNLNDALMLYEWNIRASSAVLEVTSMVEVVIRNAIDRALCGWAADRHPGRSWLDAAPLDGRGRQDIEKARARASRNGRRAEVPGRVIAELSLGFWRFLIESRYFTSLWVPATHDAFPSGPSDLRRRQSEVLQRMQRLHFVRNRAAHHEPIHERRLDRDWEAAIELARWVSTTPSEWIVARALLPDVISQRPGTVR